jgi:hypothetical protein
MENRTALSGCLQVEGVCDRKERARTMAKICKWLINDYLDLVTVVWFNHHDMPPRDLDEYNQLIDQMKIAALAHREWDSLRQAFEVVLSDPSLDCEQFGGGRFPFDSEEVRDIISHAYSRLWPSRAAPTTPPQGVELFDMPHDDWYRLRSSQSHDSA